MITEVVEKSELGREISFVIEKETVDKERISIIKEIRENFKTDFYYLDAMKSPISRIQSKHRFQILMRVANENLDKLTKLLYNVVDKNRSTAITSFVEINPQNLN